jgi:hypothetical protein
MEPANVTALCRIHTIYNGYKAARAHHQTRGMKTLKSSTPSVDGGTGSMSFL